MAHAATGGKGDTGGAGNTAALATPVVDGEGKGRRALITGLRGFTGRYLAHELAEAGYRVFGTALPGDTPGGPDIFSVDLCERAHVAAMVAQVQPDVVAHLAGIAFVAHSDAEQIYRVNIVATRNLLEALAAAPRRPDAVLLASSANIYGNADVALIDENVAPAPVNDYAVSKLAMENMAWLWADKLPIIITRPFNYTGVGQGENFLLPKIVAHFRPREPKIELGNLAIARDFSDVRMVARSYRRLLSASPAGQVFNVCSGQSHTIGSIIDVMSAMAGYRIAVHTNPALVRANDVLTLAGSNARLAAVIGPIEQPPLVETLRWMYQA
jgi:GDP-6-deoxy-D-talose 4-dehydrogenase